MRRLLLPAVTVMLAAVACSPPQPKRSDAYHDSNRTTHPDDNSAARKAGHAAYGAVQESKKLAKEAGHKLSEAGREARQGWNDAKREKQDQHR